MRKILLPLDGSPPSEAIIGKIAELFQASDTEIVLLTVVDSSEAIMRAGAGDLHPLAVVGSTLPATVSAVIGSVRAELKGPGFREVRAELQAYLGRHAETFRNKGFRARCAVEVGDAAVVIADYARQQDADLIAMSTHGRSGVSRLELGSVAGDVVKMAHRPVLLLRPQTQPASDIEEAEQ